MMELKCKCGTRMENVDENYFICPSCGEHAKITVHWLGLTSDKR